MNTTTWKNRALSVVLTVIMVFSMLPLPVFAAGGAVAEVDGTAYTNLIEAFDAAQGKESATVKLLADVSASGEDGSSDSEYWVSDGGYNFKSGKVTLDLNGKTLTWTASSGRAPCVYGATLTVQDNQGGGTLYSEKGEALQITSGTLNIQSGTIESDRGNALQITGGTVHITGGTIKSNQYFGNGVNVSPDTVNNRIAMLTVSGDAQLIGGSYDSGNNNSASGLCVTRKSDENPTVRLSGGTYTGGKGIQCKGTTVDTLLDGNCQYMLSGSEVTETNVDTLASGVTVAPDPNAPVAYIDADGNPATRSGCTEITAATTELTTGGWYVVKEDVTISGNLSVNAENSVSLILCDGATLTVPGSVRLENGWALNIYGQTEHTGTLKVGSGTLENSAVEAFGQHGGTIKFYGGTVTMQAKAGVQTVANGVYSYPHAGKEMKTVWTDSPNEWCTISNSEGKSVTVTKCKDHAWEYTDRGDRGHETICALCNKTDYSTTPHSYTGWKSNGADTHTGACACGAESTEVHTLTFTPNAGGLTHSGECSKCGYKAGTENHEFDQTDEYGQKCECGAYLAASYGGQNYTSLASAVAAAAENGGTVTLQKAVDENITIADGMTVTIDLNQKSWTTDGAYAHPTLTVTGGSVTVKNGTLATGSSSNADTTVVVESGKLTVGENVTIMGGSTGLEATPYTPAIEVNGGELTLSVGTRLVCGMKVADGKTLKNYLPADTAFAVDGSIIDGYVQEYVGKFTLTVVEHKTHSYTDGVCACGFECEHTGDNSREASYFQKAVCATCNCEYGDLLEDTTVPTGSIKIKDRTWFEGLINKITFGLFFKEDVTATITAKDDSYDQPGYDKSKHAVNIKYLVSDKELTNEELQAQTFTDYTKAIDLTDEQNYVVYARLTDHAGNVTYLSTDGFVIDKTAPSINDFADEQEVHICSSSYTVSVQDKNLKEVTVDGEKQTGNSITFYMAESGNTHTVVAEDWAGNTSTVKFTLHGGHNYNIETGVCENNCGAVAEVRVTDATGTHVWEEFGEALRILYASETPVTVTLLKDCRYADYTQITKNELTVDLNGHSFGNASDRFCVAQPDAESKCKLTITGEGRFEPSILLASGSTLTVDENVTYVGGIKSYFHTYFGDKVTDLSVTLKGGKYGVINLTYEDNDGNTQTAGTLSDLTAPGYVFTGSTAADSSSAANVEVVLCTNHIWNDGVCSTCKLPCRHSAPNAEGKCDTCGMTIVAKDNDDKYYSDLNAAFEGVADGGTVTLLADVEHNLTVTDGMKVTIDLNGKEWTGAGTFWQAAVPLTVTGGSVKVKNGRLNQGGASSYANTAVVVNGGSLTVGEDMTVRGAAYASGVYLPAIEVKGGELTLSKGTNLEFGMKVSAVGKTLASYLPEGTAFADGNGIINGYVKEYIDDDTLTVVEHGHSHAWDTATNELVCACGDVKETDTAAPTFGGIADGETYYQNTLTFTAEDIVSGIKEVKDGDTVLIAENGNYTITADNKVHTITATDNAGNTTTVTVTVYKVYNVTLVDGEGYTVTASSQTVGHGQDYDFRVDIKPGYSKTSNYKIIVNDVADNAKLASLGDTDYDSCTYLGADGDLTVTVEGIADITAPDVEMTIGANKFKELLNSLTFGLFFKKTQTVTVTATDLGSRVDDSTAAYLVADGVFDKTSMPTEGWTSFEMKNGKGSFSTAPNAKGSVYVRVRDKAGNTTVINSKGMVVYTDSTADTERISFTRLSDEDVSFKVNLNGNWFDRLLISDGKTTGSINGIISSDGTVTLKNEELRKLAVGEYTITVTYSPLGQKYVEAEGNDAPAATTVKLTVVRATRTLEFSAPNAVYDGEAYDELRITDKPGRTTVHYKEQDADDSTYDTTAPKNAGSYTVKITVDADENYNAATFIKDFTISPKEVTIEGVVVKAVKEYDGSAAAENMNIDAAYIDGKCTGDDLTIDITDAAANFSDKNVGVGKTVTFSGFKLGGSAAENYKLTAQPASVTADITTKALTIANLKVKDKVYDGTNAAEIDGTPTLNGVLDGDTLTLVNGTPVFDSTAVGEDIAIIFTAPFALAGDEVTVKNYTLTQPKGITGNIVAWIADGSEYSVNSGDWINTDFTVTAKTGYLLSLTDAVNGTWTNTLNASEETADGKLTFYVKNTATGVISSAVSESYKIDKTAPTGTITFNEHTSFQKFLNTITFGLFFKDDVTVKLTASDDASGVKSVEYYRSNKALTLEEVKALTDWTQGNSFGITAEDMAQFVIYARITDNAGNIAYLSSDGAEFDTTAPEIVGVENGKTYYVTRRVAADDNNLASVKVNRETKKVDSFFNLAGDTDAIYTIVATDKAGNVTTYTVTMKPISTITDAVKDITVDNVTSADADTIDQVAQQILDIASESDEDIIGAEQWNKLVTAAENAKKLEQRIAEVSAEIDRLTEAVNGYDIAKVTSADKADIGQLITDIDVLLATDNLTDAERAALEALRATAQALLDRIAATKSAAEADEIVAVKDITKDNVALDDKDALEKAENELENALNSFGNNYTEEERKELNDCLLAVKEALEAIGNAERAAEAVKKLPVVDKVQLTNKNEVELVRKLVDTLTENEKAMLGEAVLGKMKALSERLTELAAAANQPASSASPKTGDIGNPALWIALLFISGGVITGVTAAGKKKKAEKFGK